MQRRKQTRSNQKESEYEVDRILDKRMRDGMVAYKIQWEGFPASDATWEPVENLQKCKDMIIEFEKNRKEALKAVRNHSISKQSQPTKPAEKKKEKPIVESKKTEQLQKTQVKPVPKSNNPVTSKQPTQPSKDAKQPIPLAQSRVKTLFSGVKGERLRTSQAEPESRPIKGKLASSQADNEGKGKKSEFTEQANLKRSLASHVRNQDEDYEPDNSHAKGRKMQKTIHYVDEDALPAEKHTDSHKIAEKLINRFGQKPKDKTLEPKDNSNNIRERQSEQQQIQTRNTQKDRQLSRNLKLEDDGQKRAATDKDLLAVSRMSRQANQDQSNVPSISLIPRAKSKVTDMFRHMYRYSVLDEYLILHKRMGVLNIINKNQGGRPEKPRIKMLQVGNYDLVEQQLQQVKRISRETTMEKLQSLIKFEEGWVAVGKNKNEGLFMMDVNLLHEHVWKVIKDMYKNQ